MTGIESRLTHGEMRMPNAFIPTAGGETQPAPEIFDDEAAAAYVGGIKARAIRDWRTKRGLPYTRHDRPVIRAALQ
jgi:hypothetical protein